MPAFGYGVGDFIAVGTLVGRVLQGLVESRDASTDCQSLITTLQSIAAAIKMAGGVFDTGRGNQATINGIKHELRICEKLIQKFMNDSKEFTKMSCNVDNKSRFLNELRKISWTMFKTGDIQRLQRDLEGHLNALSVLTSILQCDILLQTTKSDSVLGNPINNIAPLRIWTPSGDTLSSTTQPTQPTRGSSKYTIQSPTASVDSGYISSSLAEPHPRWPGQWDGVITSSANPTESSTGAELDWSEAGRENLGDSSSEIQPPMSPISSDAISTDHQSLGSQNHIFSPPRQYSPSGSQSSSHPYDHPHSIAHSKRYSSPPPNPEKLKLEAELKAYKAAKEQAKAAEREKQREAQIRDDAEIAFQRRMEDMRKAQEEAKREIAEAKEEAERAARERIEAERNAEKERQIAHAEEMQRAEERARQKIEAEMKAAEERRRKEEDARIQAEEAMRMRLEAAIRAEAEAKAAAEKKAAEEAERLKKIREEEKQRANPFRHLKFFSKVK